jgi:protein-tyrosine phosphatase
MVERGVEFTNVFNFRDMGGYPTEDGRTLRWGRLYRSDDLSRLRVDEHDRFAALRLRTVIDLRRSIEVNQTGRIPTMNGISYHHIHLPHPFWTQPDFTDTEERVNYLRDRYRELTDQAGAEIAQTLGLIADESTAPLVFHCVAGKDRTGVIAALVLALLGVADHDIADDYHLSEAAEPASWAYHTRDRIDLRPYRWQRITVSPRVGILNLFDDLRSKYGSVGDYVAAIGVTPAQVASMRSHLLEPGPGDGQT